MKDAIVFEAIEFAARAHRGQYRKGTRVPYFVHPINVGRILIECGCSDSLVVAGILHDTVEDTAVTLDEIRDNFGEEIARLVAGCSEPDKSDTWENRKRHSLKSLASASMDNLLVALADKLDNIRSIQRACEREGDEIWSRFNRPKAAQAQYYKGLVDVFQRRVIGGPGESLLEKFIARVEAVFGEAGSSPDLA